MTSYLIPGLLLIILMTSIDLVYLRQTGTQDALYRSSRGSMVNNTKLSKANGRYRHQEYNARHDTESEKQLMINGILVDSSLPPAKPAQTEPAELPSYFDPRVDSFDLPEEDVFDPLGPEPHQVVLLTATDGRSQEKGIGTVPNLLERVIQNRDEFCDYHGYIHHFVNLSDYDLGPNVPTVWYSVDQLTCLSD